MRQPLLAIPLALVLLMVASVTTADDDKLDVVYHVSDESKVNFALNNMQNHIDGIGGPDKINMVLVLHGPAVRRFDALEAVATVRNAVAKLQEQGVTVEACANTLTALNLEPDELIDGLKIAEQGGVTRIAELQSQGYAYIRP
ncbi:DsrE family protein [Halochromatium glycolicum]|uniref:DsrE/DsrF-like family protein n=1 Tax=Halochromatium glycolicum TaxID=85075 RepID=A0AAJ0XB48_9GAMM|nr:DsrE family protein [Halochromatium glycolicum]MBK1706504.1 hypothetical protein [Halochromatium glycolicum]